MKLKIYALLAAAAACGLASAAETAYTNAVGYTTIPIPGTGGSTPTKLQLASQGLLPGDAVQWAGVATNVSGTTIDVSSAQWTPSAYVGFFVEITDGPLQGTFSNITANTATQITVADDVTAAGLTPAFRVIKAFTVGTLLGNPPDASVMGGGTSLTAADNLLILNADTGAYNTIWYKNGGIGGTGWRASSLGTADASGLVIHPNSGLVFQRKQVADGALVVSGMVKATATDAWVEGNGTSTVLNILSLQFPVDQLTLAASDLYTGDPATGLKGGTSVTAADNVLIYNATTGAYDTIWYKNGGIGGTGWRAASLGTADAGSYVIPAGKAVLIQRKAGPTFVWNIPSVNVGL